MKAYTDVVQSRKLVEILTSESADTIYDLVVDETGKLIPHSVPFFKAVYDEGILFTLAERKTIPCWSLAALISILTSNCNKQTINITRGGWLNDGKEFTKNFFISYEDSEDNDFTLNNKELIDTCVDMIEDLHEQKIL